jgi:hypothetical protein
VCQIPQALELGGTERDALGRPREVAANANEAVIVREPLQVVREGRRSDLQITNEERIVEQR